MRFAMLCLALTLAATAGLVACSGGSGNHYGTSTSGGSSGTWNCQPSDRGGNDGCDCGCGQLDPDCGGGGCAEPGCNNFSCDACHDSNGNYVTCGAGGSSSSSGTPPCTTVSTLVSNVGNNGALLSGCEVGVNATKQHRSISSAENPQSSEFEIVRAAIAGKSDENYVDYMAEIRNVDSSALCFIEVTDVKFLDGSNAELGNAGLTFVRGGMGDASFSSFDDNCLGPQQTGWVEGSANVLDTGGNPAFDSIATLSITFDNSPSSGTMKTAAIRVQEYTFNANGDLSLRIRNESNEDMRIGGFGHYITFDGNDVPLEVSYLNLPDTPLITAGQEITRTTTSLDYVDGKSTRILFIMDASAP